MAVEKVLYNLSRDHLKRSVGRSHPAYGWLEQLVWEMTVWDDDFMGDTLHGGYQSTANGTAAAAAAIATGVVNGAILIDPGTDDDGRSDLSLGLHYQGQLNAVVAVRYTLLDALTSAKIEVGFTDVVSGTDAGAVNIKATPTFRATDAAVWCLDTDNNANLEGLAVRNGTAATTVAAGITPPAAGTYETLVVALLDTTALYLRFDQNGKLSYGPTAQVNAITADVLLTPWVFVQNRSAARRSVRVDRIRAWQRRTVNNP